MKAFVVVLTLGLFAISASAHEITSVATSQAAVVNQFTPAVSAFGTANAQGGGATATITTHGQAPAAVAPGLAAGGGSCMGSTSVGGSGIGFGVSIGSTWADADCNARADAALLHNMGLRDAAIERLCVRPEMAAALARANNYICKAKE